MDGLALLAAFTVMAAMVAGLVAVYQSTAQPRAAVQQRLGGILSESPAFITAQISEEGLRPKKVGRIPLISSLLEGKAWTEETAEALDRADLKLTVSEYVALRIMIALMLAVFPLLLLGGGLPALGGMAAVAFVGFEAPVFYVNFAKQRRVQKLESQLVEALSLLSNSLKAGFGLLQSIDMTSKQMPHPISTELRRALYDTNVGSTIEAALQSMAKRSGSKDLDIVITAMLVQQSVGGNLAEILDTVAHTMRERIRIRGEIKTLTSQQMLTGLIIGGLPLVMAGLFSVISPDYMTPLLTTTIGHLMLIGAGVLEMFGMFLIKRILAIEV